MQKRLKEKSKNIDSQFSSIEKHIKSKRGVLFKDQEGHLISNAKSKKDISGATEIAKVESPNIYGMKYSIPEYREKFDSQNIALSKFEEIRKARDYSEKFNTTQDLDSNNNNNTLAFQNDSLLNMTEILGNTQQMQQTDKLFT